MNADHSLIENQSFTHLGKHSLLKGEFKLNGNTVINSFVEGNIEILAQANLIIGVEGRVNGSINCHDLEVYGEFKGEINSTGKITCYTSSNINGKISAKNLVIEPGACVNIQGETALA